MCVVCGVSRRPDLGLFGLYLASRGHVRDEMIAARGLAGAACGIYPVEGEKSGDAGGREPYDIC